MKFNFGDYEVEMQARNISPYGEQPKEEYNDQDLHALLTHLAVILYDGAQYQKDKGHTATAEAIMDDVRDLWAAEEQIGEVW